MRSPRFVYRGALVVMLALGAAMVVAAAGGWVRFFMVMVSLSILWLPVVMHSQSRLLLSAMRKQGIGGGSGELNPNLDRKLDRVIRTSKELAASFDLQQRTANEIRRESRALRLQLAESTKTLDAEPGNVR